MHRLHRSTITTRDFSLLIQSHSFSHGQVVQRGILQGTISSSNRNAFCRSTLFQVPLQLDLQTTTHEADTPPFDHADPGSAVGRGPRCATSSSRPTHASRMGAQIVFLRFVPRLVALFNGEMAVVCRIARPAIFVVGDALFVKKLCFESGSLSDSDMAMPFASRQNTSRQVSFGRRCARMAARGLQSRNLRGRIVFSRSALGMSRNSELSFVRFLSSSASECRSTPLEDSLAKTTAFVLCWFLVARARKGWVECERISPPNSSTD